MAVSRKITIFRNHITKQQFLFLSVKCNVTCRSGSSLSEWGHRNSHATCSLELCEDEHDSVALLCRSPPFSDQT